MDHARLKFFGGCNWFRGSYFRSWCVGRCLHQSPFPATAASIFFTIKISSLLITSPITSSSAFSEFCLGAKSFVFLNPRKHIKILSEGARGKFSRTSRFALIPLWSLTFTRLSEGPDFRLKPLCGTFHTQRAADRGPRKRLAPQQAREARHCVSACY